MKFLTLEELVMSNASRLKKYWPGSEYIEISKDLKNEICYDSVRFKDVSDWYDYMTDIFQSEFISWKHLDGVGAIVEVEPKLRWNGAHYVHVPR